jgi:hypothetical protein
MRTRTQSLKAFAVLLLAALTFGVVGCGGGGGGGGGGTLVTVTGRILRAESGQRPDPAATITIGGVSGTSNATDGTFTLANVPSTSTQAVISATGAQSLTLPLTLSTTAANNLGDIFISDTGYNASVSGRVVTTVNNSQQAVGNATVTIGGKTVQTDVNGAFQIDGLPVGLGTTAGTFGTVTATGFEPKPVTEATLEFPLTAGANPLTNPVVIERPVGSTPNPPFTIRGIVNVNGVGAAGISVQARTAGGLVFGTTTGPGGSYFFWLAPDTYTVTAQQNTASASTTVTLTSLDTPVTATPLNLNP